MSGLILNNLFFPIFYLNFSSLTNRIKNRVILVSGVEFSDSSLTYTTQCSSLQAPSLIHITHLAHPLPTSPPGTLSIFFFFKRFYLREREREHISKEEGQRERESRFLAEQGA